MYVVHNERVLLMRTKYYEQVEAMEDQIEHVINHYQRLQVNSILALTLH